jgi:DNA-binding GntR family transcriptional regulator
MMSETQNATTAERIALSIGERIISGALQPDAPLRQDHIAREFGSSHVPVREAFRQLEAQHLVIAMPRRGVRVAPLDTNSVREIAEMRAALEVVALRNAAPKLTSAHFARLELALIEGGWRRNDPGFRGSQPRLPSRAGGALCHAAPARQP